MEQIELNLTLDTDLDVCKIKDALKEKLVDEEYIRLLNVNRISDGAISIKAKDSIVVKLVFRVKSSSYMLVRVANAKFFPAEIVLSYDEEWAKIEFKNIDGIIGFSENIAAAFVKVLKDYEHESFGCCSQYLECSNAKHCVNKNKILSEGCAYKSNLEHGRIFYGENRNVFE